jgi:hypothetical protein
MKEQASGCLPLVNVLLYFFYFLVVFLVVSIDVFLNCRVQIELDAVFVDGHDLRVGIKVGYDGSKA